MTDVRLVSIGTAVPPTALAQDAVRELFLAQPGLSRLGGRLVTAAFDGAAVDRRHTVIGEFAGAATQGGPEPVFYDAASGRVLSPGTGTRNAVYTTEAPPLALAAARRALEGAPGIRAADVTHVVTVSCTGFFAPGPDYVLVRELGLAPTTRRLHVGFMGCHGAFPALAAATDACRADPDAVVLVVCVELCSLHLHAGEDPDVIVASALFADGAAAAVVTARETSGTALRLDELHTVLTDDSADDMTWTIGDEGFQMRLSSYVPRLLQAHIGDALEPLRPTGFEEWGEVERWAIHPGGRSILDRVQDVLGLAETQLADSRAVLRENGNMSSPTVLFVLDRMLRGGELRDGERLIAAAFGPGLTVEAARLTVETTASAAQASSPAGTRG